LPLPAIAQAPAAPAETFHNPILFADYSDPDVIRDGDTYYLVASSFEFVPGLPILQSKDLVHWTIIAHAVQRLDLGPAYDLQGGNRYGGGVWAPALRKHDGRFYVFFPTPDEGIFMTSATVIAGPWTRPVAVIAGPGLEDPCPFWDDDGQAYLVHSKTGAGPLILHRMAPDGTHVLDPGTEIFRDPIHFHTLEGPKFYKRNGFYYIMAPYGGVSRGSQAVLRSKSIDGPYEARTVLAQGSTKINGPHQGAYVETPDGQPWFVHFQSRGAHGRIVHLEPVRWEDDWPVMGSAPPGAITGEPVASGEVPHHAGGPQHQSIQTSDEFSSPILGLQWEWNHNPVDTQWSLTERPGFLRLHAQPAADLFTARNTITQVMQDESLDFTIRLDLHAMKPGDHAGLAMFEKAASGLEVIADSTGQHLSFFHVAESVPGPALTSPILQLRAHIQTDTVTYAYSLDDGKTFVPLGPAVLMKFSWWKGSRPALFDYTTNPSAPGGTVDIDWAHYQPLPNP
jgi:beta-xylosidase